MSRPSITLFSYKPTVYVWYKIQECVAPYSADVMKRELKKSHNKQIVEGNTVRGRCGKLYDVGEHSCSCFIWQFQQIMCSHMFSYRKANGLSSFSPDDVPKQHLLENYLSVQSIPESVGSWNVTVSAGSTRAVKSLSQNDKFGKARDVLNQICDELSEENKIEEFEHKLDMFRGILDAVKDRRRVHWFTDST